MDRPSPEDLLHAFVQHWNAADADALAGLFTEDADFVIVGQNSRADPASTPDRSGDKRCGVLSVTAIWREGCWQGVAAHNTDRLPGAETWLAGDEGTRPVSYRDRPRRRSSIDRSWRAQRLPRCGSLDWHSSAHMQWSLLQLLTTSRGQLGQRSVIDTVAELETRQVATAPLGDAIGDLVLDWLPRQGLTPSATACTATPPSRSH